MAVKIRLKRLGQKKSPFYRIINELAKKEKVDENLKQNNQLEWVRCMNNLKNRAEEIVLKELIYC